MATFRIPSEDWAALTREAERRGISRSALIRSALTVLIPQNDGRPVTSEATVRTTHNEGTVRDVRTACYRAEYSTATTSFGARAPNS
jgi:hypothetical protein